MRSKRFIDDDDAVSPVIGVILMVAITVILAAVIATFVLGLGEQIGNTGPSANFDFEYDGSDNLTITHTDGQTIDASELYIRGDKDKDWSSYPNATTEVSAGDSILVEDVEPDYSIMIVWESNSGGQTATLQEWRE